MVFYMRNFAAFAGNFFKSFKFDGITDATSLADINAEFSISSICYLPTKL